MNNSRHYLPSVSFAPQRGRRLRLAFAALACLSLVAITAPLEAQYVRFGKNKVQYTHFDWHVLSGPHVDVFYYPDEEMIARAALSYAEQSFDTLVSLFRHRPFRRVPLIIYSSHQHFEQTNVTPAFLPEGVAGFTEFLKRRIALPYNGNYKDFRHTIRHELVHFFQLSKLSRVMHQYPGLRRPATPLWWSEGLAERWSSEQDADDVMFVRDLVLSGKTPPLPSLAYNRSFLVYPLGGQIHRYLGERFGYDRVADLYESLWKYRSFEEAFAAVYGVTLKELDRQWRFHLERTYYPEYSEREPVAVVARSLIPREVANFKPVIYENPDGEIELLYMSPRTGYTSIYSLNLSKPDSKIRRVLLGHESEEFESLHFFESGLDVSSTGKLVFVSKYLEKDAIFIWDLEERKVLGRYRFPDLVSLASPSWSPDGTKVVFSALATSGLSDLYVLDFSTQEHYAITDDRYLESDPDYSPDGRYIVFSSDRTASGNEGHENLFLYDLEGGAIEYLTYGPWRDFDPRWSPDGEWIAFTSSRNGFYDLHLVNREGEGGRITNFTGGAFDAEWTPDGDALIFGAFERGTFKIYHQQLERAESSNRDYQLVETFGPPEDPLPTGWAWAELEEPVLAESSTKDYETRFSLDFAAGQATVAPGIGASQGVQFLASDLLGNHLLFLAVGAQQFDDFSDLTDVLRGQFAYLNLSRRVNWGAGVFRFAGRFVDRAFLRVYEENTVGGFFLASYPFSKFRRVDFVTSVQYSDRRDLFEVFTSNTVNRFPDDTLSLTREGVIATNSLSYIKDNTLWLSTGPIDGTRWNFSVGLATDLTHADAENYQLQLDIRRYFRTGLTSALAVRLFGYFSEGTIPARIAFGGSHSIRLYPYLGFYGSRAWMLNNEWRFPLTRGIAIGFPFGTLRFPGIQAAPFVDVAQIWIEEQKPQGIWGSYGVSFRMGVGFPLVLRLDVGRRFKTGSLPIAGFGDFYGTEVDFFIGFNF